MPFKQNYPTKAQFIQACMDNGWVAMGDATALSAAYDFVEDPKGLDSGDVETFLEKLAGTDAWDIESRNELKEKMQNIFRPLADEPRLADYNIGEQIVNRVVDDLLSQDNLNLLYDQQQKRIDAREEDDFSQAQDALDQDLIIFEARRNGEVIYRDATQVQEEKKEEPVQENGPQVNELQDNAVDLDEFQSAAETISVDGEGSVYTEPGQQLGNNNQAEGTQSEEQESVYSDAAENDVELEEALQRNREQNLRNGLQGQAVEYVPEPEENRAQEEQIEQPQEQNDNNNPQEIGEEENEIEGAALYGDYDADNLDNAFDDNELGGRNAMGPEELNGENLERNTVADPDAIQPDDIQRDSFVPGFGGSRETTFNMRGDERNALGGEDLENALGGELFEDGEADAERIQEEQAGAAQNNINDVEENKEENVVENNINDVENDINNGEEKKEENIAENINNVENNINNVENNINNVENNINNVENNINDVENNINDVENNINDVENNINGIENNINGNDVEEKKEENIVRDNSAVEEHRRNDILNSMAGIDLNEGFLSEDNDLSSDQLADNQIEKGKKNVIKELNLSQLENKISGNNNLDDAVIYDAPKRGRNRVAAATAVPALKEVQDSLKKFNTSRLFTSSETVEHERARQAAEKLIRRKSFTSYRGGKGLENPNMNEAGKFDAAVLWLKDAADLHQKAARYAETKNPLSPAGRSRKEGAEQLAAFANKELKAAEAAIVEQGMDLREVYQGVAAKQLEEARNRVFARDFNKFENLSERDQQLLCHDILDIVAAEQAKAALEKDPQNIAGGNFYAVRNAMERNVGMVNAVTAYLSNPNVDAQRIRADVFDENTGLMKNMRASLRIETDGRVKMDDFVRTSQQMAADSSWNKMPAKQNQRGM